MGSVINVFTKFPEKGWHSWFQPEYGKYDYEKRASHVSYGGEKLGFSMDYVYKAIGNYWTRKELVGRDYDYVTGTYTYYDTDEEQGHQGWREWNHDYKEHAFR